MQLFVSAMDNLEHLTVSLFRLLTSNLMSYEFFFFFFLQEMSSAFLQTRPWWFQAEPLGCFKCLILPVSIQMKAFQFKINNETFQHPGSSNRCFKISTGYRIMCRNSEFLYRICHIFNNQLTFQWINSLDSVHSSQCVLEQPAGKGGVITVISVNGAA